MAGYSGITLEDVWGVPQTPDVFQPVLSSNLTIDPGLMRSAGIRASRRTRNPGRRGPLVVGGTQEMELPNETIAAYLFLIFGAVSGSGPLTFTPGSQVGTTKSGTLQTVITDTAGVNRPFTAAGTKFTSATISAAVGEFAKLSFDWSARNVSLHRSVTDGVTTSGDATITSASAAFTAADIGQPISGTGIPAGATIASVTSGTSAELSANASATGTGVTFTLGIAAATASYGSIDPYSYEDSYVTVAGTQVASARSMSFTINKALATDRHVLGSRFIREQLESPDHWEITSEIQADFDNLDMMILFLSAQQVACTHNFVNSAGDSLVITTSGQVVGDPPSLTGIGLEQQTIRLDHSNSTSDANTVTAVLTNSETGV